VKARQEGWFEVAGCCGDICVCVKARQEGWVELAVVGTNHGGCGGYELQE